MTPQHLLRACACPDRQRGRVCVLVHSVDVTKPIQLLITHRAHIDKHARPQTPTHNSVSVARPSTPEQWRILSKLLYFERECLPHESLRRYLLHKEFIFPNVKNSRNPLLAVPSKTYGFVTQAYQLYLCRHCGRTHHQERSSQYSFPPHHIPLCITSLRFQLTDTMAA